MSLKEKYKEIKVLMKKLRAKGCFQNYSTKDMFYLLDERSYGVFLFSERLFNEAYGCELYLNAAGLNCLYDILYEGVSTFSGDSLVLSFSSKKDLNENDIAFLKQVDTRIYQDNNLVLYRFKEGYPQDYFSSKDCDVLIDYLNYVYALMMNDAKILAETFEQNKVALAAFDNTEMSYSLKSVQHPNFEQFPALKKKNEAFVEDLKGSLYLNENCFFFHQYLPFPENTKEPYPSIFFLYFEKQQELYHAIHYSKPSKVHECALAFLNNIFGKKGLPTTIFINHRKIYATVKKTLEALNIETYFERGNERINRFFFESINKDIFTDTILMQGEEEEDYTEYDVQVKEHKYVS